MCSLGVRRLFLYFFIADRAHDAGCEQVATFDKKLLTEDGFMAP